MVNEISQNMLGGIAPQSKGAAATAGKVRESSALQGAGPATKALPGEGPQEATAAAVTGQKLDRAVEQLNKFAQSVQRTLEFSVDEESGKTIVKVIDKESGQMVRSIPSEEVLNMQKILKETSEAIFDKGSEGISLLFQGKA